MTSRRPRRRRRPIRQVLVKGVVEGVGVALTTGTEHFVAPIYCASEQFGGVDLIVVALETDAILKGLVTELTGHVTVTVRCGQVILQVINPLHFYIFASSAGCGIVGVGGGSWDSRL